MARRRTNDRYPLLRSHAARIIKLAEYPMHVNGAYMDDPDQIPRLERGGAHG